MHELNRMLDSWLMYEAEVRVMMQYGDRTELEIAQARAKNARQAIADWAQANTLPPRADHSQDRPEDEIEPIA